MMTSNFIFRTILLWAAMSVAALSQGTKQIEIEAQAVHQVRIPSLTLRNESAPNENEFKNFSFVLYLKNVGHRTLRLPTEPSISMHRKEKMVLIDMWFHSPENPLDRKVRIPDSRFGIVSLKPGESTIVRYQAHVDQEKADIFQVSYEIPASFAEEYDLWSGKLVVPSEANSPKRQ